MIKRITFVAIWLICCACLFLGCSQNGSAEQTAQTPTAEPAATQLPDPLASDEDPVIEVPGTVAPLPSYELPDPAFEQAAELMPDAQATPNITLEKDEVGTYIGSMVFDTPYELMGIGNGINVRSDPSIDESGANIVTRIGSGQRAEAYEIVNGWYRIKIFPTEIEGYIRSDLLQPYDPTRLYFARPQSGTGVDPYNAVSTESAEVEHRQYHIVDVKQYLPQLEYEMIFATPYNFTGEPQYERDMCLLQAGTVEKLAKAQAMFAEDGYTIKVYDAYRPASVSGVLFDIIGNPKYIARPGTSAHNRAAAVDISLVDSEGNELEMPTPMHTLDETANRDYADMTETARENMNYMTEIMKEAGFATIASEWWHFSDSNVNKYPAIDIPIWKFILDEYDAEGNLIVREIEED